MWESPASDWMAYQKGRLSDLVFEIIGLGRFDELAYDHIVQHPGATPEAIAEATGAPLAEAEGACSRLTARGLLLPSDGEGFRPSPLAPDLVCEQLRWSIDAEHAEKRKQAIQLRDQLIRMLDRNLLDGAGAPGGPVTPLPTAEALQLQLLQLVSMSRQELLRVWTGPNGTPHPAPPPNQREAPELRALGRDLHVRILCPLSAVLETAGTDLRRMGGAVVRTIARPPVNFYVFDRRTAVVEAPITRPDCVALTVQGEPLVGIIRALFETWWSFGQDVMASPGRLDRQERALLQLLGEGAKDDHIARQLGLSVRTVRRRISELLGRLEASSRFQAGVLAARRGWI